MEFLDSFYYGLRKKHNKTSRYFSYVFESKYFCADGVHKYHLDMRHYFVTLGFELFSYVEYTKTSQII